MSQDPRLEELLAPLRDEGPELDGRPVRLDRDRALARMADAARDARRDRSRTRRLAMLAAAAGFALILGATALRVATRSSKVAVDITAVTGNVTLHGPAKQALATGGTAHLSPEGDLTTAPASEARIRTESGLELAVFENSRVALDDLRTSANAVRLGVGAVRCSVPRLAPKQTFSVVTPDATVVVHGTVFSVEVRANGASTETTVRVTEGVVVVRHAGAETELRASQFWTNHPIPDVPPATATESAGGTIIGESPKGPGKATNRRPPEKAAPNPGTLDQETRLLRSGLAAERNGDLVGAAGSFEQLLSRYPQSPLVPDARAALDRVRARHGQPPP